MSSPDAPRASTAIEPRSEAEGSTAERGAVSSPDAPRASTAIEPRSEAEGSTAERGAVSSPDAPRASTAIEPRSTPEDADGDVDDAPSRPVATPPTAPLSSPRRSESAPAAPWSRFGALRPRASSLGSGVGSGDARPRASSLGSGVARPRASSFGTSVGSGDARPRASSLGTSVGSGDARPRASSLGTSVGSGDARPRGSSPWLGGLRTPSPSGVPYAAKGTLDGPRLPPGLGRPPSSSHLSPRMTAIFGGLFGLATLTSLIALLIQGVPVRDERALVAAGPAGSGAGADEAPKPSDAPEHKKKKRTPLPGPWRVTELAKDPSIVLVSDVMERRSFIKALGEKGVPTSQIYRILKAFDGLRKFDKCGRKDRYTVAMDRSTRRVRAFEYQVSASEIYQARENADGLLTGVALDMKIAEEEVVASFYVGKDIERSYQAAGLEPGVLDVIDEALSGRMSTESFEEGSTVRLIGLEETALGLFSKYKKLIALEYRPADPAEKPVRIYDFTGQEARGYFDERGRQPYSGGWRAPVPGAPVTSRFNPKRLHPVLKKVMPHNGTDFGAPTGTPVYAAYRGVVDWVGPSGPSGNLVTVTHPNGIQTGYAHLSRFAPGIRPGMKIGTRQLVGYVGSTGRSTGPHLHFTAKKDGKYFDAETLQLDGERVMPPVDRAAFAAVKEALDKRLDAIPLPEPPPEPASPEPAAPSSDPADSAANAATAPDVGPSGPDEPAAQPSQGAQPPEGAGDDEGELIMGPDLRNLSETM